MTAVSPADRKLAKRFRIQFVFGALVLAALILPSLIHSAAAIGTLRNLPALWLPEDMPIRKEFFHFIDNFAVTDVLMVSWPEAKLGDASLEAATAWLEPLSRESMSEASLRESDLPGQHYESIYALSGGRPPFQWVRSGQQLVDRLSSQPVNLTARQAATRLRGSFVGSDLAQTCVLLSLDIQLLKQHRELLPLIQQGVADAVGCDVSEVKMVGGPVDGAAVDGASIRSIARFSLPSSAIAALLCLYCLRSLVLSATILAVATITQGMALASIYYAGFDLNAVLIILPAFVFVLTISAGIHLSNYFIEGLQRDPTATRIAVIRAAMAHGRKPCTMSVLTTIAGLLSLLLVRIQPVQLFGVVASGALLFSLAMLLLMMPGAMLFANVRRFGLDHSVADLQGADAQGAGRLRLLETFLRHRSLVLLFFALLTAIAACGLGRLHSSVRIIDMFAQDSQIIRSYRWFEQNIGPTMVGDLLISFDDQDDSTPLSRYQTVRDVHIAVAQSDGVGGVNSCVTFLPNAPRGKGIGSVTTRAAIRTMIEDDSSSLYRLGMLRNTDGGQIWRLTFRLYQTDQVPASERLETLQRNIDHALKKIVASRRPQTSLTGHIVIVEQTQKILLEDLVRSFLAALVLIAIFLSIMVGNVFGGLLSLIPNLIPTLVLFGMMGWCDYSLNIGSVMTASVALGIAVDDSLHLLAQFRMSRETGLGLYESAVQALRYCGVAMLQTTLICGCSLAVYYASEFIPTQQFAVFMALLLAMAWLGVAVLLPAMMTSRVGRWLGSR